MVYQCEHCDYLTNRQSNFLRHKNRKSPCSNTKHRDILICSNKGSILKEMGSNIKEMGSNIKEMGSNIKDEIQNVCCKCNKLLSCKKTLQRHENICKGVSSKTCLICFKVFNTHQGKYYHNKFVNCTPPPQQPVVHRAHVINNNTTNNNTTNNINNSNNKTTNNNINNNNIQINVFGNEDLNYLLNDKNIIQKLKSFGKSGIYGLPKILNEIHFNKDKPENNTLIKPEEYGNGVMIMNDDKEWEYREFEDIRENLIHTIVQYFKAYNTVKNNLGVKLIEKKERNIVKNFAYEFMSLEGTIPPDLFQELEMNEEEIEEGEEEMKNIIRKLDKSTMKSIHRRTSLNYKKENGSYVKK